MEIIKDRERSMTEKESDRRCISEVEFDLAALAVALAEIEIEESAGTRRSMTFEEFSELMRSWCEENEDVFELVPAPVRRAMENYLIGRESDR